MKERQVVVAHELRETGVRMGLKKDIRNRPIMWIRGMGVECSIAITIDMWIGDKEH